MPGKDARRTALIQVKIVALAPMPNANVVTTTKAKPGLLNSVRRLYRKSCQKVSITYRGSQAVLKVLELGYSGPSIRQAVDCHTARYCASFLRRARTCTS